MIYEVYTTHIHYQVTQIKKSMFYKQFWKQLFEIQINYCFLQLKKQLVRHIKFIF